MRQSHDPHLWSHTVNFWCSFLYYLVIVAKGHSCLELCCQRLGYLSRCTPCELGDKMIELVGVMWFGTWRHGGLFDPLSVSVLCFRNFKNGQFWDFDHFLFFIWEHGHPYWFRNVSQISNFKSFSKSLVGSSSLRPLHKHWHSTRNLLMGQYPKSSSILSKIASSKNCLTPSLSLMGNMGTFVKSKVTVTASRSNSSSKNDFNSNLTAEDF